MIMDIDVVIEKSYKLKSDSIINVHKLYDSLRFRVNLLMVASTFPFILAPFLDLYIPVLFLNGALLLSLAVFDHITVEKELGKDLEQHKKNINNLYDSYYKEYINTGENQT